MWLPRLIRPIQLAQPRHTSVKPRNWVYDSGRISTDPCRMATHSREKKIEKKKVRTDWQRDAAGQIKVALWLRGQHESAAAERRHSDKVRWTARDVVTNSSVFFSLRERPAQKNGSLITVCPHPQLQNLTKSDKMGIKSYLLIITSFFFNQRFGAVFLFYPFVTVWV